MWEWRCNVGSDLEQIDVFGGAPGGMYLVNFPRNLGLFSYGPGDGLAATTLQVGNIAASNIGGIDFDARLASD